MAAQDMMDRENVLSLERIKGLFNKSCQKNYKFFGDVIDGWIKHPDAKKRLFGITTVAYQDLTGQPKDQAKKDAKEELARRPLRRPVPTTARLHPQLRPPQKKAAAAGS